MPITKSITPEKCTYLNGFDSYHESETIKGSLPIGANSPQGPPYGLYAEKLSSNAFTAPSHENRQSWLYRILPSAYHSTYQRFGDASEPILKAKGLRLVSGAGDPTLKRGPGIYISAAGRDLDELTAMYPSDSEMLIVAQHGVLDIQIELSRLFVRPNETIVMPRGIRYRVTLPAGPVRGYVLELYQGHFTLPELRPIGSSCLANVKDFQISVADFQEETGTTWTILNNFNKSSLLLSKGTLHLTWLLGMEIYPYKYDLGRFNTIGSTSFHHSDPPIYTVLTDPSDHQGTAVVDFAIFPPRWLVQEDTFRPPWYHRNTMSEFTGLICGQYDAKTGGSFQPVGASLHNIMSARTWAGCRCI
ncbi:hypothetical protein FGRMN_4792 [Fusarium graminum]|nr:hypothetical protein FGRMN_4792 [Fusarium graminum]